DGVGVGVGGGGVGRPATRGDVMRGGVDRLPEAPRHVLQVASVIGRRFPLGLLRAAVDAPDPPAGPLRALEEQELIFRVPDAGEEYRFKHALVQDAIYETLLRPRREELHRRGGGALEQLYAHRLRAVAAGASP